MEGKVDGRRARGDITRRRAARCAADIATVSGLESISVARIAAETGLSKSGILTVFDNRKALQLAAIDEARDVFVRHVISPAWGVEPGLPRLRAYVNNWFAYVSAGVFTGGCFLVSTSSEFAGQHGDIHDAIRDLKRTWIQFLEGELSVGRSSSVESRRLVVDVAFKLDSFMTGANIRFALLEDSDELLRAKDCCLTLLESLA